MGIVLLMSAFNRRFSGGGVWFIQDKFALTGNLVIKTGHTENADCRPSTKGLVTKCRPSTKCGLGTKCRLQTEYKIQTLGTKCRLQNEYKMQTRFKM